MAKIKTKWICQNCGYETPKSLGKCPDCGTWASFVEEVFEDTNKNVSTVIFDGLEACTLKDVQGIDAIRFSTGLTELDRVLGGGLVEGSLILLSGDPGIGKSTLLLQAGANISNSNKKVLYATAEESASQIKLRAERLEVKSENLYIFSHTNLEAIKNQIEKTEAKVLIIDSIQAIYTSNITSSQGSVSQIRECTNILMEIAKKQNTTVIVVGHVTKDGTIAGPKVLEHMVDAVLYFEGDKYKSYRVLRGVKNRFGNTNEVGIFNMADNGLEEVLNPSEIFLQQATSQMSGSVIIATNEGTRALLLEIQALTGTTSYAAPRRVSNGIEFNRLLQIIAILEKRIGLNLSKQDVYVNVIGGIDIDEPAADLGVALAVATCARNVVISNSTVIIGELGLSGEVRPVCDIQKRLNEAEKLGLKKAIIPRHCNCDPKKYKNLEIIEVDRLIDAITACCSQKAITQ